MPKYKNSTRNYGTIEEFDLKTLKDLTMLHCEAHTILLADTVVKVKKTFLKQMV